MFLKCIVLLALVHHTQVWADECPCDPCVNLDAAINFGGYLYLFHGAYMMQLSDTLIERAIFNTNNVYPGFPPKIDAAFVWPYNNYMPYFLHGSKMNVIRGTSFDRREYPGSSWSSFVAQGVDAVAMPGEGRGHSAYFMRGCEYQIRGHTSRSEVKDLRDLRLPCHPDAAITESDEMLVIKGDKYWRFDGHNEATGPFPMSEKFHIRSWKLCPATY